MTPVYAISNRIYGVAAGPSGRAPGPFQKFLDSHKGEKIVHVWQGRMPVNSTVQSAVNGLSLGRYKKKLKQLGEPTAYHDYLIVETDKGDKYRIEKNHVMQESRAKESDFKNTVREIPVTKELDLPTMFATASRGDEGFWKYSASNRNCQDAVVNTLKRNGLEPAADLPKQDARTLVDTIVGKDHTTNAITNTTARVDRLIHGYGVGHDLNHPRAQKGSGPTDDVRALMNAQGELRNGMLRLNAMNEAAKKAREQWDREHSQAGGKMLTAPKMPPPPAAVGGTALGPTLRIGEKFKGFGGQEIVPFI